MPAPLDLDDIERAALVALLRETIENTRWPLAPRTRALRAILDKLEPPPPRPELSVWLPAQPIRWAVQCP